MGRRRVREGERIMIIYKIPNEYLSIKQVKEEKRMKLYCVGNDGVGCHTIQCKDCLFNPIDITEEQREQFLEWEKENNK